MADFKNTKVCNINMRLYITRGSEWLEWLGTLKPKKSIGTLRVVKLYDNIPLAYKFEFDTVKTLTTHLR